MNCSDEVSTDKQIRCFRRREAGPEPELDWFLAIISHVCVLLAPAALAHPVSRRWSERAEPVKPSA